ncbi:hypothetical protein GQ55_5G152500 [Panicum hallii var. hallii]|uniref:Uncharacterized protein n=1 Tax=Panicum hallii var. hallii TaxID=1504633 RepID=A0A2T7DGJ1_9POAL|nr:hypothetical protein GQ55_5G152500 [Panicum hallii var. hallii]
MRLCCQLDGQGSPASCGMIGRPWGLAPHRGRTPLLRNLQRLNHLGRSCRVRSLSPTVTARTTGDGLATKNSAATIATAGTSVDQEMRGPNSDNKRIR